MVNLGNGQIRYAMREFEQSWNLQNKLVPLPLEVCRSRVRPERPVNLNIDRARIDKARAFAKPRTASQTCTRPAVASRSRSSTGGGK